jgi:hypothetical protein
MRRAQALVAVVVGGAATASPRALLRVFGIAPREVTGAAALGWRLFGVRTAAIGAAAARGDERARAVFLPVQVADQAVFAYALRTRAVPRRAAVMAMATSGVVVALDLAARSAEREAQARRVAAGAARPRR